MKRTILLLLLSLLPLMVVAVKPDPANEWPTDPERKMSLAIFEEVTKLEAAKSLKQKSKQCRYGSDKFDDIGAALYIDNKGLVRKYVVDRELTSRNGIAEYYYDKNGMPRFTKRTIGENYGLKNEERIYFNEKGKHLYTDRVERNINDGIVELPDSLVNPNDHFESLCK